MRQVCARRPTRAEHARRRDDAGAVAVMVALITSAILFGIAALVVDMGLTRDTVVQSQNAADASALAAANTWASSGSTTTAAQTAIDYATVNFHISQSAWAKGVCTDAGRPTTYVVASTTDCVSFDTTNKVVRVHMPTRDVQTGFAAGIKGNTTRRISIAGTAEAALSSIAGGSCGFCVLENASISGNPALAINGAGINFNGTPSISGSPSISTNSTFTVEKTASISGRPALNPSPTVTGARVEDPFATLAMPFTTAANALPDRGSVNLSGQSACSLLPGRYGDISLSGQVQCTLAAGLYAITGQVSMSGTTGMDATSGVTLYFTCGTSAAVRECGASYPFAEAGGTLNVSGTNNFDIKAPTSGATQGLAIAYDRNNTSGLNYSGTNGDQLWGSIYAKSATMNLSGTADSASTDSMIVVKNLNLSGNGTITNNYTAARNAPVGKTKIRLSK